MIGEDEISDDSVMHRILREKGVLSQYAATGVGKMEEKENREDNMQSSLNRTEELSMLKELMDNVKRMQEQLDEIKASGLKVAAPELQTVTGQNTLHRFMSQRNV